MKNLITVLLVILSTIVLAQKGDIIDKVVGVVGEEIILKSEVETQLLQYIQSGAPTTIETRCNLYEDIMYQKNSYFCFLICNVNDEHFNLSCGFFAVCVDWLVFLAKYKKTITSGQ